MRAGLRGCPLRPNRPQVGTTGLSGVALGQTCSHSPVGEAVAVCAFTTVWPFCTSSRCWALVCVQVE
jgi:hypothetical protein